MSEPTTMLERIAAKWAQERGKVFTPESIPESLSGVYKKHARFFMLAIADELEVDGWFEAADKLRTEATQDQGGET